jgi:hypothetical protein
MHYANVHFKEKIYANFGMRGPGSCPLCGKTMLSQNSLLWHFGIAHGFVEACLEPEFRIPGRKKKEKQLKGKILKKSKKPSMKNKCKVGSTDLCSMNMEKEQTIDNIVVDNSNIDCVQHFDNTEALKGLDEHVAADEACSYSSCSNFVHLDVNDDKMCQNMHDCMGQEPSGDSKRESSDVVVDRREIDTKNYESEIYTQRHKNEDVISATFDRYVSDSEATASGATAVINSNNLEEKNTNTNGAVPKIQNEDSGASATADQKCYDPALQIVQVWSMVSKDDVQKPPYLEEEATKNYIPDASYSYSDETTSSKSGGNFDNLKAESSYVTAAPTVTECPRPKILTGRALIEECFSDLFSSDDENDN